MKWHHYFFILPIKAYQYLLSPILGKNCRYEPSCSNYMIQSIQEWGVLKGTFLGLKRILRCHPWGGSGDDPVPKKTK
jgi:putative membrane protein insertion efficiency factor